MRLKTSETYRSLFDLISKWRKGYADVIPGRESGRLALSGNILWAKTREGKTPVGYPIKWKDEGWRFWYLVTNWRRRLSFRNRLDELGGVPCMPFELAWVLKQAGLGSAEEELAAITRDIKTGDKEMMDSILRWLVPKRHPQTARRWRRGIVTKDTILEYERESRKASKSTLIARQTDKGIDLLGQAYRSPDVLWLRDAVYVAVGRMIGRGVLPEGYTVQRMGGVTTWTPKDDIVHVTPIPEWVFREGARSSPNVSQKL